MNLAYATLTLIAATAADAGGPTGAGPLDLSAATVVVRGAGASEAERTAAAVLVEEVEKRTGVRWATRIDWPAAGAIVVVTSEAGAAEGAAGAVPEGARRLAPGLKPEGFVLGAEGRAGRPAVWVVGADARGVLFGVGKLLRAMAMAPGRATLEPRPFAATSPAYPIRGHQLGYRNRANSWDAWGVEQFDQYVRELALFGANCVENIPFQDDPGGPLMRVPREEMNVRLSEVCRRYDQDYWVWTPADFDLADADLRRKALRKHEALYRACPRLDAVFVPGGDPGENDPALVLPFLKDLAGLLAATHPKAKVWLSLQGFRADRAEFVYKYLDGEKPDWFGGIVCGPSSPPIPETRARLDGKYPVRHYPDLTHNVRCQYPVPWWDPALAFTLGREAINPRPVQFAAVHNALAPDTAGFLSYSDGVHDDVNKVVWSALAWDPGTPVREVLVEYARVFFAPEVAEAAADGLLALETNWAGPLRDNGGVEATLALWQGLEKQAPRLEGNWRWQMCLLRAVYDAYTRSRLIHESALEELANARMAEAPAVGADAAVAAALEALDRWRTHPVRPDLRRRIDELCGALFRSVALQTSVTRHHASGAERGCVLDFVDHPLNSRWWLEDELAAVRKLPTEAAKLARLDALATWEHPGPGSFYDDVGDPAKSPHVVVGDLTTRNLVGSGRVPIPEVLWWDDGSSRARPAWMTVMDWPVAMRYPNLDPDARYVVRTTGYGTCLLSIDGRPVQPTLDGKRVGEFKEFPVPRHLYADDGAIELTFTRPVETVNWRYQSRLSELWLLKVGRGE